MGRFWLESEPERRVQNALYALCPRRSHGSGDVAYLRRRLRRFGAAAGAAAAFLRRLRRFGAAAAFFAFFRAAIVHPLCDESTHRGSSRARTLSPFLRAVKTMFHLGLVGWWGPGPTNDPTRRTRTGDRLEVVP